MSNHVTEIEPPFEQEASLPDSNLVPVGVERERVDPHTLQVIQQLFPAPTSGPEFLALLLRWATTKQLSHGLEESSDVAVVTVQSIRQLAGLIGWAYETTHKYVVLFCALGLLTKYRVHGKVELHFALHRYEPPLTLDELDRLTGTRKKVASCARRVKRRFLLLYGPRQRQQLPSPPPQMAVSAHLPELHDALVEVEQLLQMDMPETAKQRLTTVQTKLERVQGRLSEMQGDSSPAALPGHGRLAQPTVDSASPMATRNGRFQPPVVDSEQDTDETGGRLSIQKVDSVKPQPNIQGRPLHGTSTFSPFLTAQKGRLSEQQVDSTAKKVDSSLDFHTSNVNVIQLISNITLNVKLVATFCCQALEEPSSKRGIYLKLFRECERDAQAIAAALLFVLAHRGDGTMRNPASVFVARCRVYHAQGIPEEAATLVKQYGSLSYRELLAALSKPPFHLAHPSVSSPGRPTPAVAKGLLAPLPSMAKIKPLIALRPGGGMNRQDAGRLHHQIAHDQRLGLCRTSFAALADGTYAVLLDNTVSHKVRQVAFYSIGEWQTRSTTLTDCFTLFSPADKAHSRRLLKAKGES